MKNNKFYFFPLIAMMAMLFIDCQGSAQKSNHSEKTTIGQSSGQCMKNIISQDDRLGKVRNHACEKISLSETIRQYADELEKLDFGDCPEIFTKAFSEHISAWRAMVPLVEKYPNMRGEMHQLFDELEKSKDAEPFKILLKNIWDTWAGIESAME